jgi:menaquinone-dependent protoporphyrinogen oxidase
MTKVFVVYGSRHGATRGIEERIGAVMRSAGLDTVVGPANLAFDVGSADAFVIGSGVYMGSWLSEPLEFMRRNQAVLAGRPTWLFSSGPLAGSTKADNEADPVTNALGPLDGPGSGGRKKVEDLSSAIHPRGHEVFLGAFDPNDPPKAMSERLVRMVPGSKKILPTGDFRNWDAIETWATKIATELRPAPVG